MDIKKKNLEPDVVGIIDKKTWKIEKLFFVDASDHDTDLPIFHRGHPNKILFHSHPSHSRFCQGVDFPSLSDIFITLHLDYPYHVIFVKEGTFLLQKTDTPISDQQLISCLTIINDVIRRKICRFKSILMVAKFLNKQFRGRGVRFEAIVD